MKKKTTNKRSLNAKKVAVDVSENIRKGKRVNLGKILQKNGYSKSTAESPSLVTNTKSYKEVIDPFVKAMMSERNAAIKAMAKVRDKAKYRDFTDALDKLTKNIQLLQGKDTEKFGGKIIMLPARK